EGIGKNCACQRLPCTTRCTDCFQSVMTCDLCFIQKHKSNPLHWAERWNGEFFERYDMSKLGQVITLGHHGEICPRVNYEDKSHLKSLIMVDVNGIHSVCLAYCRCAQSGDAVDQLLGARVFPASVIRPGTGFTFNLLETFHMDCLQSKKSAYDYVEALRRRTSNAFPTDVPDPYNQFLLVMRVWRALKAEKRSGQGHGIDKEFPDRPPGSIVVPCFACPEPGFNMDDSDFSDHDIHLNFIIWRHATTLFLSADGHFGLMQKAKNNDPEDISLMEGKGFFPPDGPYQEYVAQAGTSTEASKISSPQLTKSTCAKLHAANAQNKHKFRGCRCSGIVAVTCARHCIFRHGAIADLQLGEKYSNTYHALAGGVRYSRRNRFIVLTYDIACQFCINLKERFAQAFPTVSDIVNRIRHFVPKLHIQGHKDDCQYRWSLNFSRWTGRTDGERIESSWTEAKQAGGMTKEMNTGHRHDTLTDFQNDWNWVKAQKLAESLRRHLIDAKDLAAKKLDHYIGLSLLNGSARVESWSKLSTEPKLVKGEWHSVYRYKEPKFPSQAAVYRDMLDAEIKEQEAVDVPSRGTPIAIFLDTGFKIQSKQQLLLSEVAQAVRDYPNVELPVKLEQARHNLSSELNVWRKQQAELMSGAVDHLSQLPAATAVEHEVLLLPSDLSAKERTAYAVEHMVEDELCLRKGQAHDALRSLRAQVKYTMALSRYKVSKKNAIHGQYLNTRVGSMLRDANERQTGCMKKYQRARDAMIRLGLPADSKEFPKLGKDDLWTKNSSRFLELGDGRKTEGWIWRVGLPADMSEGEREEYLEDADRVQWFRAKADMERWQEEVEILTQEFRRAIRGFEKMDQVWSSLA
ncbi:hypothetical protein GALMADRAFT_15660, partial [Galerina marginata CBS 339.88]